MIQTAAGGPWGAMASLAWRGITGGSEEAISLLVQKEEACHGTGEVGRGLTQVVAVFTIS